MRKKLFAILLSAVVVALCGCGKIYSESDIKNAREQGYNEGYCAGYDRGVEERRKENYDNLLIDGRSIRNIQDQVYDEFGLTPAQAFGIVDEYEYDSTHGGFTWSEYQNAIEAIYYTASIFPEDY